MAEAIDSKETLPVHAKILRKKKFYQEMLQIEVPDGPRLEIGSGGGFLRDFIPSIITSDVVEGPGIDKVFSVTDLPLSNDSVAVFYLLNVFHHVKDVAKALAEMQRCLKQGGKIIMIEPHNSWWGRFVYSHFHHEDFNPQSDWKVAGDGRLSDANNALPWIVFERDKKKFEDLFPLLTIKQFKPHTPFSFIISGGLTKPELMPSFMFPMIMFLEKILAPLNKYLGMFVTIELQKKS